jgi:2-polyprenyl-3-methyl-5-hydroxy-6-metoxy-1,4-benzoquinol methylase
MAYLPRNLARLSEPVTSASVIWEETNCLLCGGSRWTTLLEAPDRQSLAGLWFAVVQCQDCGLCFTNPRPHRRTLDQFYPDQYKPHQIKDKKPSILRRLLGRWGQWRPPFPMHGQGRLLDFGCGSGTFLKRMKEHGWRVVGIDTAAQAVERASETDVPVLCGSLPHPELEPHSFDVITMWHSLEHVPDPKAVLKEARRLLDRNGKLIVAAPNIDSFPFRMFGHAWYGLDLPRHLTHFAPWTLHVMLERAGFHVQKIRMVRHSAWLRHSAEIACQSQNPQPRPVHRWLRQHLPSRLTAWYSCVTGQSDCMMATAIVSA